MRLSSAPSLISALAVLALVPGVRGAAQPAGAADTLTGTLRSVDANARQVEVLTAVGHALRLVTIHVEPDCVIRVDGAPASLGTLKPGRIVRIAYGQAAAGTAAGAAGARSARAIETLPKAASGRGQ